MDIVRDIGWGFGVSVVLGANGIGNRNIRPHRGFKGRCQPKKRSQQSLLASRNTYEKCSSNSSAPPIR